MKKAIVLLSGGLDSTTSLYWALNQGYETYALLFDYGQRHKKELIRAKQIAKNLKIPYRLIKISLPWKGSSLLDKEAHLPKERSAARMSSGIPNTYVPARNTIFLSFALSYAEVLSADIIVIGANAVDYSGYPDCRPNYIKAMQKVANLGTKKGGSNKKIKIRTPLIKMTKCEIIKRGLKLGVPYKWTWSCYQGGAKPCGQCDSCILRRKGFKEAGVKDRIYGS